MGLARRMVIFYCLSWLVATGCGPSGDSQAAKMCAQADELDKTDEAGALTLRAKIWKELPTTGTTGARDCGRQVRERMGHVRTLVSKDEHGDRETVEGCRWAATAVEKFSGGSKPPYRDHWARRLMERCVSVVGRAWARDPDSQDLRTLNNRLTILAEDGR